MVWMEAPAGRLLTTRLAIDLKAGSVHPDLVNSVFNSLALTARCRYLHGNYETILAEAGLHQDWTYGSSRTSTFRKMVENGSSECWNWDVSIR